MGTLMQEKAAKLTVEKVRKTGKLKKGEIIREVGYSEAVSLQPHKVFDTEGFKEELAKLGFDSSNAKRVVAEILNGGIAVEEKDRLKAAELVFKVHGDFEEGAKGNTTNNFTQIVIHSSDAKDSRHISDS